MTALAVCRRDLPTMRFKAAGLKSSSSLFPILLSTENRFLAAVPVLPVEARRVRALLSRWRLADDGRPLGGLLMNPDFIDLLRAFIAC